MSCPAGVPLLRAPGVDEVLPGVPPCAAALSNAAGEQDRILLFRSKKVLHLGNGGQQQHLALPHLRDLQDAIRDEDPQGSYDARVLPAPLGRQGL